jgi:predicted component of type VI protein secretion system
MSKVKEDKDRENRIHMEIGFECLQLGCQKNIELPFMRIICDNVPNTAHKR